MCFWNIQFVCLTSLKSSLALPPQCVVMHLVEAELMSLKRLLFHYELLAATVVHPTFGTSGEQLDAVRLSLVLAFCDWGLVQFFYYLAVFVSTDCFLAMHFFCNMLPNHFTDTEYVTLWASSVKMTAFCRSDITFFFFTFMFLVASFRHVGPQCSHDVSSLW